jgi:16S rRNA (cytidine1402-2'-O)-methyltransferase
MLPGTLALLASIEPSREVAVCRELTKLHEEVLRGSLSDVLGELGDDVKGEVVVVVGGDRSAHVDVGEILEEAAALVGEGMRKRDAARTVAERHGVGANALYRALVGTGGRDEAAETVASPPPGRRRP